MNCEYVRDYYNVPACIGRRIKYKDREGVICIDGGNYVAVNFDDDKPGFSANIHPTDPNLTYLGMGKVRKMTRSQQRYQDYLSHDGYDSFAEYMGFLSKAAREKRSEDQVNGRVRPNSYYRMYY